MRCLGLVTLFLVAGPAWAQQAGDAAWITTDVVSKRFPDATTQGPAFDADDPVTVLVRDGDTARVMAGDRYGWVSVSALTLEPPAAAEPAPLELTPMPGRP